MASTSHSEQRGNVKDPEHDGRLKENREAGRTKGTTPGSQARKEEPGRQASGGSHSGSQGNSHRGGDANTAQHERSGDSGDLKSREYRDEKGEVHHHTRTYMEQHEGKR